MGEGVSGRFGLLADVGEVRFRLARASGVQPDDHQRLLRGAAHSCNLKC
jgi:hypothetical protein